MPLRIQFHSNHYNTTSTHSFASTVAYSHSNRYIPTSTHVFAGTVAYFHCFFCPLFNHLPPHTLVVLQCISTPPVLLDTGSYGQPGTGKQSRDIRVTLLFIKGEEEDVLVAFKSVPLWLQFSTGSGYRRLQY